ncbi:multiple sugar transport system permease protein [Aequitasia blattaphilus]|uniref:Sugar ABC transporter permease n=1 Tax=Aequitasia blattaphilus TaxID=2949332 RepID=A0ABT1EB35_9FIRM|nr:sugar ABC transporter permease [Aequitasia blattaphilus]MCP1103043.1 sugar ABC transporter permease [Aequitasia blattaphilus]MCR8615683.1 sugar ABC transporter permease [Aequitasia blattaphilus]
MFVKSEKKVSGEVNYNKIPAHIRRRPYYIIAPGLIILIGILIPFVTAIFLSFTNYSFRLPKWGFVGLKNWINMFKSKEFYHAVWVTLKYGILATGVEMLLGTGVALLLRKDTRYSRILKVLFTFPLMVAPAIAVLIWQLMTSNTVGVLEKVLNIFGVYNFPWAASHSTAMFTAILIDAWVNTSFVILLVLAGIQSLPKSPFEAAAVDGAGGWFTFKTLTFPMLKPFMYIALLFRLMASLQEFGIIYALSKGGPGDTLMNISLSGYINGFTYQKLAGALPYLLVLWFIINKTAKFLVKRQRFLANQAAGR